jgi:phosphoribosylamine--glycine ligase
MTPVLLVGNGAREHAIAEAIMRSRRSPRLYAFMKANNPGIADLATEVRIGRYDDTAAMVAFARAAGCTLAVVGPEEPLSHGVVDSLQPPDPGRRPHRPWPAWRPPSPSPVTCWRNTASPAIPGSGISPPRRDRLLFGGVARHRPQTDGLTGGKGVLVQGDHFATRAEALALCQGILREHPSVTVEEKLEGEEFSLQCLSDGKTVLATPPVQDHKRRFAGDKGPNTGGMGSYSGPDHLLPFLDGKAVAEGLEITRQVAAALLKETGQPYQGVLYGGFMTTASGVRLIEYNARFGDPEAMNILPLLRSDFIDLCQAIVGGRLTETDLVFEKKATVCKYCVPKGYGLPADHTDARSTAARIEMMPSPVARLYTPPLTFAQRASNMTTSLAEGVGGIADN